MNNSKYGHLIDLHNKAIDILEKRNNALVHLQEAEASLALLQSKPPTSWDIYTPADFEYTISVQRRYISLLSRAYSRLASSVCTEVSKPSMVKPTEEGLKAFGQLFRNAAASGWEVVNDGNDFHVVSNTSTDATKAD